MKFSKSLSVCTICAAILLSTVVVPPTSAQMCHSNGSVDPVPKSGWDLVVQSVEFWFGGGGLK